MNVYNTASKLYNEMLGIYFDKYFDFPEVSRKQMDIKYNLVNA